MGCVRAYKSHRALYAYASGVRSSVVVRVEGPVVAARGSAPVCAVVIGISHSLPVEAVRGRWFTTCKLCLLLVALETIRVPHLLVHQDRNWPKSRMYWHNLALLDTSSCARLTTGYHEPP